MEKISRLEFAKIVAHYHAHLFATTGISRPNKANELATELLAYMGVQIEEQDNNDRTETGKDSNTNKTTSRAKGLAGKLR
jgi:hypothetical protein